jgi:hypothetical protein
MMNDIQSSMPKPVPLKFPKMYDGSGGFKYLNPPGRSSTILPNFSEEYAEQTHTLLYRYNKIMYICTKGKTKHQK